MTGLLLNVREYYWAHREAVALAAGAGAFLLFQAFILLCTFRRLQELSHIRERISRLADGLALLADTTEAGLSALVRQVELVNARAKAPRAASRVNVARRVADAARNGERPTRIAEREALSESEVRLHIALSDRDRSSVEPPPLAS